MNTSPEQPFSLGNPTAVSASQRIGTSASSMPAVSLGAIAEFTLQGCGGGGGGSSGSPDNTPQTNTPAPTTTSTTSTTDPISGPSTSTLTPPTEQQAARFLMQASFGGNYDQVQSVQKMGFEAWLDAALNTPWDESNSHFRWFYDHGYFDSRTLNTQEMGVDNTLWRKLLTDPQVLRQRVAYALSQIFVVSMSGLGAMNWRNVGAITYMDLLEKNAFTTYEKLLTAITLSPAMGVYLNMKGSRKASGTSYPDENYARELMQLFSIGLYQLNKDGSLQLSNGKPIETYTQENVTQLAAIFTGWWFSSFGGNTNPSLKDLDYLNQPMTNNGNYFTSGDKRFFDQTVPASATPLQALQQVLHYLASHPNVGPFIGRQLIQRLVCSNPSPAYVQRISKVFDDDGQQQRGNLKAVIKAILLDDEARNPPSTTSDTYPSYGKLKEPVYRLAQWGRTFNANASQPAALVDWTAASGIPPGPWNMGNLSDDARALGQAPMRSPTVFNFYRPGYVPGQGDFASRSVTAPEFQICNEVTVAAYLNFMNNIIDKGRNDISANYSNDIALSDNPQALVKRYALLLTANGLSSASENTITEAISKINGNRSNAPSNTQALDRIKACIFLIMACPEYMVQK